MTLLPFVSRGRYEDMRDRARKAENRVDELTDQLTRISRRRNGMPEQKREEKKNGAGRIPKPIRDLVGGFESDSVRHELTRQVRQRRRAGDDWDTIYEEMEQEIERNLR